MLRRREGRLRRARLHARHRSRLQLLGLDGRDIGLIASLLRLEVALIDARDDLAGLDLVALLHQQLNHTARHLGIHIDFLGIGAPPFHLRFCLAATPQACQHQ